MLYQVTRRKKQYNPVLLTFFFQKTDVVIRESRDETKENWRPLPSVYEGPVTSPFAMGRGVAPPGAQRGILPQNSHYGVMPLGAQSELKNPFGRGRGIPPLTVEYRGVTPPAVMRESAAGNSATGVGRGFSQLRIE